MAAAEMIALSKLGFAYPGRKALFSDLSLVIEADERVGLVGPNGSGKTSVLHLIMGLLKPSAGMVMAFGRETATEQDCQFVRKKIGLLFQDSDDQLFCPTVSEDVAFGPMNHGASSAEARAVVSETLELLSLSGYEQRLSHELSGGEKRLVALATVLAMKPEALLLDEPSAGLDPRAGRELVALLARIGGAQLICSHDMEFVRATCRRVILLDAGRVAANGPTDEILGNAELMLSHGLEVPYSIEAGGHGPHDHRHGAGVSHGHGHLKAHDAREHATAE
jgi:cobalt/nickel transport system ATP-binding protein